MPRTFGPSGQGRGNDRSFIFVISFANSTLAADYLKEHVKTGDVVLIKGSQSMRMEKITHALLNTSHNPEDHLVRQEVEWKNK